MPNAVRVRAVIAIDIEDEAWRDSLSDPEALVARAAQAAIDIPAPGDPERTIAILLTDDAAVADLNQRFRGKPTSTNVLSFPAAQSAYPHLGDVALAYGVCAREAEAQGKSLADHLTHLVVHGVLHLLGYDHETEADAEVMEHMECEILRRFGVADPYAQH
jgi:probable rRNA maturation factor